MRSKIFFIKFFQWLMYALNWIIKIDVYWNKSLKDCLKKKIEHVWHMLDTNVPLKKVKF
jgi:hypothetical protein